MTDKQTEAMKLALKALEHMLEDAKQERLTVEYWNECVDAITALREALAEPDFWEGYVPEPVKPAQQEPVQRYSPNGEGGMEIDSLGAWVKFIPPQPAQRTWVELTDEEVDRALDAAKVPELPGGYESVELEIARAIEAKLKEKNT